MKDLLKISGFYAVLAIGLFLILSLCQFFFRQFPPLLETAAAIESRLHDKEAEIKDVLDSKKVRELVSTSDTLTYSYLTDALLTDLDKRNLALLVYKNDSLVFWTNNRLAPETLISELEDGSNFLKFRNGWYELIKKEEGDFVLIGVLPVKAEFSYQNRFLENEYNPELKIPGHIRLLQRSVPGTEDIRSLEGNYLFSISADPSGMRRNATYPEVIAWIFILLFSYLAIDTFAKYLVKKNRLAAAFSLVFFTILGFRLVTLYLQIPDVFYSMNIFKTELYTSTLFFPSLGDIVLNSLLGVWMIYFTFRHIRSFEFRLGHTWLRYLLSLLFIFIIYGYTDYLSSVFERLIVNSDISFDVTNILSFSRYSILGFIALAVSLYSFFLLTDIFLTVFHKFHFTAIQKILILATGVFIYTLYKVAIDRVDLLLLSNTAYVVLLDRFKFRRKYYLTFPTVVFILGIFSLVASTKLNKFIKEREMADRKELARKLAVENDPVAEHLFSEVAKRLQNDTYIKSHFRNAFFMSDFLYERIRKLYFGGYFSKYDLGIFTFNPEGKPLRGESGISLSDFDSIIAHKCRVTPNPYFFCLDNTYGLQTYYGKIPLTDSGGNAGTLVIELQPKFYQVKNIFPELLLEGSFKLNREFANYSFSVYRENKLVSQQGEYPYNLSPKEFSPGQKEYAFIQKGGYDHLVYHPAPDTFIVVSRKIETLFKVFAIFSYIFGFLSVFLFLLYLRRTIVKNISFLNSNFRDIIKNRGILFKTRIQFSIIITVIASLLVIGYITFIYITRQYDVQQEEHLNQKIHSIIVSFDKKAGTSMLKDFRDHKDLPVEVGRLSDIYDSDINLFDLNGNLITSSQPKIYEEGLISGKMNARAFTALSVEEKSQFTSEEQIGNLRYISAYAPVRNNENQIIAYLNLPYFENKNQYKTEISSFLTTLINVYVFIFVLVGFLAFFLANSITSPLTMIEEQLRETKIGKQMEPIEWKSNDEIGNLIQEYNRMIRELEISTNKLASTERDYAWREMAKQIAHEIKNPLTPIKLGIQHMVQAWKDKDPQFNDKFQRFTKTIIQQIESLTVIASQFSNFAQMPPTVNKAVDLQDILKSVVNLYKDTADMSIILNVPPDIQSVVLADENQMISTFNNLIKNAIQAIPEERKGIIDIEILNDRDGVLVMIQDNGVGIQDESKDKIFAPNFTTKNSGMGLGLAIIKNIITHANGKIWFHSSVNKGTTFYVSLPVYHEQ